MKIFMIKSKWTEDNGRGELVTNDNPNCFLKAESDREAIRVFRKGFHCQEKLTVIKVEELTWELFNQIAPDEFMLVPNTDF